MEDSAVAAAAAAAATSSSSSSSSKKRKLPSWVNLRCAQKNQNQKQKQNRKVKSIPPSAFSSAELMVTPEQIKPRADDDRKPVPFLLPDVHHRCIKPSVRSFDMESSGAFSTVKSREESNSETRSVSHLEHHQYFDADQASDSSNIRIRSKRLLPASLLTISPLTGALTTEEPSPHPPWNMLKMLDSSVFKEESSPPEGLMSISLLKHQRIALAWMEKMENKLNGGILADDQGLGKTIETLALILKEKPIRHERLKQHQRELIIGTTIHQQTSMDSLMGGTLIVCPTSVLKQWEQEIKGKIVEAAGLSILVYHGSNRIKDPLELANHDIVLTTYAIIAMEAPKQPLCGNNLQNSDCNGGIATLRETDLKKRSKGTSSGRVPLRNGRVGSLYKVFWFRIVLDEAQNIKNPRTRIANACWMLKAEKRWCLSGTPVQNAVDDLYSYFRFLNYAPYSDYKVFQLKIKNLLAENPSIGFRKLHHVLQRIMLRRTKETLIDGKPILNLPKKIVSLIQIDFSPTEREFYTKLEAKYRKKFQMYAAMGDVHRNYVNILSMLLCLRQACDHPSLVKDHSKDGERHTQIELLSPEEQHFLISRLKSNSDVCSICMDIPEDAVVTKCAHIFCRQCISQELERDDYICCPNTDCDTILQLQSIYSWSSLTSAQNDFSGEALPTSSSVVQSNTSSKINAVIKTILALPMVTNIDEDRFRRQNNVSLSRKKALVFSQWTKMLDLLEISLDREGICYRRLDGTMSTQARERALSEFKTLPEVTVMLLSLKAASLGLNMIEASHVLLVDAWWNPTTEQQAIDRAHRIGQENQVIVSQFTVRNTIEDRMLALQERKRQMVASAFGENGQTNLVHLTESDISYLFHV